MLKIPTIKRKRLLGKLDEWYENDMSGTHLNFDGDW